MTTPHDPQGTDREDELLRAVLAEEDAAEEVEHGRRDPISPVARDRLRSGTAAAPAPTTRPAPTPSALAEGLARTGPDTATIRQVEAASPWTRLHSPQDDDDVALLVPTGPRPGAGEEDDPAAPPVTDAAVQTDDPAGHGARRRTALLLGALVLLALIAVVLAIVLN